MPPHARPAPPRTRGADRLPAPQQSAPPERPWQVLSRRLRYLMTCPLDFEPVDDTKMSFERSHRDALLPVLRQVRLVRSSAFRLLRELLAMAWASCGMLWPYEMLWCVMHQTSPQVGTLDVPLRMPARSVQARLPLATPCLARTVTVTTPVQSCLVLSSAGGGVKGVQRPAQRRGTD